MNFYCTRKRFKSLWSYSAFEPTFKLKPGRLAWSPGFSKFC